MSFHEENDGEVGFPRWRFPSQLLGFLLFTGNNKRKQEPEVGGRRPRKSI